MHHLSRRSLMTDEAKQTTGGTRRIERKHPAGTVRKNFNLPQSAIDRAREALGTKTETETVLLALETAADDLLIALTCREVGAILLTANTADFELIRSVTGVHYAIDLPLTG
jgi:predicted nucleic acid-binding protein